MEKEFEKELEKKWFVVNAYSGHENKVKENLEKIANSLQKNIM